VESRQAALNFFGGVRRSLHTDNQPRHIGQRNDQGIAGYSVALQFGLSVNKKEG
jgi:hypothetical protein